MNIQKLRLQKGWSQQQLADISGLSVRTIQRIEGGQSASTETLKSLASVFEIDFLTLTSEPPMEDTQRKTDVEEMLAFQHVRRLRSFYLHLIKYLVVMTGLALINLWSSPHHLWVVWPALGWGLGLVAHASSVFDLIPFWGAQWEREQVEKRLGRPL